MQNHEAEFSKLTPIKTLVMTWNAGASTPYHLRQDENDAVFFRDLIRSSDAPDILVFGFQELVDLEDKKTTASMSFGSGYGNSLKFSQKVFSSLRRKTRGHSSQST